MYLKRHNSATKSNNPVHFNCNTFVDKQVRFFSLHPMNLTMQSYCIQCFIMLGIAKLGVSFQPVQVGTNLLTALLRRVDPAEARGEFVFFFFGGSGALGIGAAQIPKLIAQFQALKSLAGGVSRGGEDLQCNPLSTIGYPEPLKALDVEHIIQTMPTVEAISTAGRKKSYMAQLGYLERQGFYTCCPVENPLALCAVFDAVSGGGSDLVAPQTFSSIVSNWRRDDGTGGLLVDLHAFKLDLLKSSFKKYSAFAVFILLLALVMDLIVESGVNAFL